MASKKLTRSPFNLKARSETTKRKVGYAAPQLKPNGGHSSSSRHAVQPFDRKQLSSEFLDSLSVQHPMVPEGIQPYSEKMKTKNITPFPGSTPFHAAARITMVLVTCSALGLLAGCATEPESHVVSESPPPAPVRSVTTTTTTTSPDTMPATIVGSPGNLVVATVPASVNTTMVTVAPPALQSEVVLAQPAPNYVWVPGYWTWRNEGYQWIAGSWQLPPNSSSVWIAPRCEQQGNGYRFTEGYWN